MAAEHIKCLNSLVLSTPQVLPDLPGFGKEMNLPETLHNDNTSLNAYTQAARCGFFPSTHNTWNGLVALQAALFSNVGATPHLQARFLPPGSFSGKCLSNPSTIPVQPAAKAACREEKSIKPCDLCVTRYTQMHAHAQFRIPLLLGPIQLGITWGHAWCNDMVATLGSPTHTKSYPRPCVLGSFVPDSILHLYTSFGNGLQNCHLSESCLFLSLPKILCWTHCQQHPWKRLALTLPSASCRSEHPSEGHRTLPATGSDRCAPAA